MTVTKLNILFYIEPMVTYDDPYLFLPWWRFDLRMIESMKGDSLSQYSFYVITNEPTRYRILEEDLPDSVTIKTISQDDLLTEFNHDYLTASISWYQGTYSDTQLLHSVNLIKGVLNKWVPDIVITFSPAPFIGKAYPNALVLNCEVGLTSRPPFSESFYLDPMGHYKNCYLNKYADELNNLTITPYDRQLLKEYRNYFINCIEEKNPLSDFISSFRNKFDYIILVPLQHSRYYSFDGNCEFKTQFQFAEFVLDHVPSNIGVIVTSHPSNETQTKATISHFKNKYSNFLYSPILEDVKSSSQYLLGHVDGVVSVSSMVGMQTLLWKKKLITIGDSHLKVFSDSSVPRDGDGLENAILSALEAEPVDRDHILFWLLTHYFIPNRYICNSNWFSSYIINVLKLHRNGQGYQGGFSLIDDPIQVMNSLIEDAQIESPTMSNKNNLGEKVLKIMKFTGERYVPEVHGNIELEHVHRYLQACEIATGKRVLDIASGEGFGSAMLARKAIKVTGVDISLEAVSHARKRYEMKNLDFMVGSCTDIPFPDSSVDLVVSFETIEHHDQHDQMMKEVKRVLRPGGFLLISSPDKYNYSVEPSFKNPFHIKELYEHEFKKLLGNYFQNIVYFGQRVIYGSSMLSESNATHTLSYLSENETIKTSLGVTKPIYWIALASDSQLPELASSIFEQPINESEVVRSWSGIVYEREQKAQGLAEQLAERDQAAQGLAEQLAERDQAVQGLAAQLAERDQAAQGLAAQLMEREQTVHALTGQIAERGLAAQTLTVQLAERGETIQALTTQVAEMERIRNKLEGQLREIWISRRWWIASFLGRMRVALAPPGSRRTRVLRLFYYATLNPLIQARQKKLKRIRQKQLIEKDINLINSSGLFDKTYYLANNPDVAREKIDPALHFLFFGGMERRDPGPLFDSAFYLTNNPDVAAGKINPLIHYLHFGIKEERAIQPGFNGSRHVEAGSKINEPARLEIDTQSKEDFWIDESTLEEITSIT